MRRWPSVIRKRWARRGWVGAGLLVLLPATAGAQPVVTEFPITTPNANAIGIAKGPDGNLWFTENDRLGRISPTGAIVEFGIPTASSGVEDITRGPTGTSGSSSPAATTSRGSRPSSSPSRPRRAPS